jgi:hypothetical protein
VAADVACVAAEVAGAVAEVTADVTDVVAEVVLAAGEATVLELAVGAVAACACRESASKMMKIPAATIATCTTRQAMCRKIDCGMSSSRSTGRDRIRPQLPISSGPKHAGRNLLGAISPWSPGTGDSQSVHQCTHCSFINVQRQLRSGKGWRMATELGMDSAAPQVAVQMAPRAGNIFDES